MRVELPKVIHTYQNHALDSTRWQHYQPRADDIVIATPPKSGMTWMQEIVYQLLFYGQPDAPEHHVVGPRQVSLWLEYRASPLDALVDKLEAQ